MGHVVLMANICSPFVYLNQYCSHLVLSVRLSNKWHSCQHMSNLRHFVSQKLWFLQFIFLKLTIFLLQMLLGLVIIANRVQHLRQKGVLVALTLFVDGEAMLHIYEWLYQDSSLSCLLYE